MSNQNHTTGGWVAIDDPRLQEAAENAFVAEFGVPPDVGEKDRLAAIEEARDAYGSDDIEIDDDAVVAPTDDGGLWVQAWVWLAPPDDDD